MRGFDWIPMWKGLGVCPQNFWNPLCLGAFHRYYTIACFTILGVRSVTPQNVFVSFLHLGELYLIWHYFSKRESGSHSRFFLILHGVFYHLFTTISFETLGIQKDLGVILKNLLESFQYFIGYLTSFFGRKFQVTI